MQVSIIIINYNTFQLTCDCISSIIEHTRNISYEIILVDNASPNDNPTDFLLKFPGINLVRCSENGGFAKGNNAGIDVSSGEMILLLNSDTVLIENSILLAYEQYKKHERVGFLGVQLIYPDGKLQHTARKFRSIKNEILDLFRPALMLMSYRKRSDLMLNQYFRGDYSTFCDWVSGAFMLFDKSLLKLLPLQKLDERFFMYGEDELWCMQMKDLGYSSYYFHETKVIHVHSGSTSASKQLKLLKVYISHELIILKEHYCRTQYFYLLKSIFLLKEYSRYYIKMTINSLFKYRIR